MFSSFTILLFALIIDRWIGDPPWLWQKITHPVVLFGAGISYFEKRFNRIDFDPRQRKLFGILSMVVLILGAGFIGLAIQYFLKNFSFLGSAVEVLLVAILLAQKSLADHVKAVETGLTEKGLAGGRYAVSMIVGRDADQLDETGICRAAIESLAENSSDGIIAPAFWFLVFGLPGLFIYKLINTADSMIGHLNEKYRDYGWFAARIDDVANWIPARLTGWLTALTVWLNQGRDRARHVSIIMRKDAASHRSPNAGWPETAFAAAINIALSGPRQYGDIKIAGEYLNRQGRHDLTPKDIGIALELFWRVMTVTTVIVLIMAMIL